MNRCIINTKDKRQRNWIEHEHILKGNNFLRDALEGRVNNKVGCKDKSGWTTSYKKAFNYAVLNREHCTK